MTEAGTAEGPPGAHAHAHLALAHRVRAHARQQADQAQPRAPDQGHPPPSSACATAAQCPSSPQAASLCEAWPASVRGTSTCTSPRTSATSAAAGPAASQGLRRLRSRTPSPSTSCLRRSLARVTKATGTRRARIRRARTKRSPKERTRTETERTRKARTRRVTRRRRQQRTPLPPTLLPLALVTQKLQTARRGACVLWCTLASRLKCCTARTQRASSTPIVASIS
mmetsp:Transcript_25728/g.69832  ORF Transcript_25728/g.69832 Transcript_25728/m.69832 type:complete len:226 (+) Transcript_25728:1008-1685(+)